MLERTYKETSIGASCATDFCTQKKKPLSAGGTELEFEVLPQALPKLSSSSKQAQDPMVRKRPRLSFLALYAGKLWIPLLKKSVHLPLTFDKDFPVGDVRRLTAFFEHRKDHQLLTGIAFHGNRISNRFGYCTGKISHEQMLKDGQKLAGFRMALIKEGIIGIKVIV